ncbi:MAG: hypothetical protein R2705_15890 [Ilumatobacteraceae bacterium]
MDRPRDPDGLDDLLTKHDHVEWVQVPYAGVENLIHLVDHERR